MRTSLQYDLSFHKGGVFVKILTVSLEIYKISPIINLAF